MRILFWASVAMFALTARLGRAPGLRGLAPVVVSDVSLKRSPAKAAAVLLGDLRDDPGPDRPAALADGESEALVHGDRLDQLDLHRHVVARHDHLGALGQLGHAGDVGGTEVELRPVAAEERRVASALLLLEDV